MRRKQCNKLARTSGINIMFQCYESLGYTSDCAWLTMMYVNEAVNECKDTCVANSSQPDNDPFTCELSACKACIQKKFGYLFALYAGRSAPKSGIVQGDLIIPCAGYANIKQDPCAG